MSADIFWLVCQNSRPNVPKNNLKRIRRNDISKKNGYLKGLIFIRYLPSKVWSVSPADPHDFVNLTFKLSGNTENHLRVSIKEMDRIFEAFLISYLEETHMHDSKSDSERHAQKIKDRLVRKTKIFLTESQLELLIKHASVDR